MGVFFVLPLLQKEFPQLAMTVLVICLNFIVELEAGNSTQTTKKQDEKGEMIRGLAFGFGGFLGFIILLCLWWRCCCSNGNDDMCQCCQRKTKKQPLNGKTGGRGHRVVGADHNAKISPSPPSSVMSWSRNS